MNTILDRRLKDIEFALDELRENTRGPMGPGQIGTSLLRSKSVIASTINVSDLESVQSSTGDLTVTGTLTMGTSASMFSANKTTYADTDAGFWLGYNAGAYKVNIGDATSYMKWDGSTLSVAGSVTVGAGGSVGGWTINSSTITSASNNVTLDAAGTITAGTGNNVAAMSGAGTIRFWAGNATAASAPFQVSQAGVVTGTSFSSNTVAGTLAAGQNLGANDITIASTGKIKFGTSAADYLANDILHFEVAGAETAKVQFKNGSNTPYGELAGWADASRSKVYMQAHDSSDFASVIVDGNGTASSVQLVVEGTAGGDALVIIDGGGFSYSDRASAGGFFSSAIGDFSAYRRIYPGDTSGGIQTHTYMIGVAASGTLPNRINCEGNFYPTYLTAIVSTDGTGALVSPTRYITIRGVTDSSLYYIPVFTDPNNWAA